MKTLIRRYRHRQLYLPLTIALGVLCLLLNYMYGYYLVGKPIPVNYERIAHQIDHSLSPTESLCLQWIDSESESQFIENMWRIGSPEKWNDRRVSITMIQGDSVLFWSESLYNDKTLLSLTDSSDSLVDLDGSKVLIKQYVNGSKRALVILELYSRLRGYNSEIFDVYPCDLFTQAHTDAIEINNCGFDLYVKPCLRVSSPLIVTLIGWFGVLLLLLAMMRYVRMKSNRRNVLLMTYGFMVLLIIIRILINYVDIPEQTGDLFVKLLYQGDDRMFSLGGLLVSFGMILIYAIYIFLVRNKIAVYYRSKGLFVRRFMLISYMLCWNAAIAYFHYAMVNIIYSTDINVELYELSLIDFSTMVFYIISAIFVAIRIFVNRIAASVYTDVSYISKIILSVALLTLLLIPLEDSVRNTGYILLIFHSVFLVFSSSLFKFREHTMYLILIVIFSVYIMVFASIESRNAADVKGKSYARSLIHHKNDATAPQVKSRYREYTYTIISSKDFEIKNGNSFDIQRLVPVLHTSKDTVVNIGNYRHYIYDGNTGRVAVVSVQESSFIDSTALFIYIFVVLYFGAGLILALSGLRMYNRKRGFSSLTIRIRGVVIGIVLFSMISVGSVVLTYAYENYGQQQRVSINNETRMVLTSIDNFVRHNPQITPDSLLRQWFLTEILTDEKSLAIYDSSGRLINTTMRETVGQRVSARAYSALRWNGAPYFNRTVDYRGRLFSSAWVPIYSRSRLLGYLNLVQLDSSSSLANDPRYDLLTQMINLFVIIIALSLLLSMVLYKMITKPLQVLHQGLSNIADMKKITLVKTRDVGDEIGTLILQYNKMIDYLEQSYEALARTERDGAWREMARQVAHEIKNPLTPMRLKIQMLKRAREQGLPGFDERLDSTLETLLEQIGNLARIATEFSDFAKMGEGKSARIDLTRLLANTVELYSVRENDTSSIELRCDGTIHVDADYQQLQRVFINLLQNAQQAVASVTDGRIRVEVTTDETTVRVEVIDNGVGIAPENVKSIFQPNFTTKSSGSGLGLAISRQIVLNTGGSITFISESGTGTTFVVSLPLSPN